VKRTLSLIETSNSTKHLNKNKNYNKILEMPFIFNLQTMSTMRLHCRSSLSRLDIFGCRVTEKEGGLCDHDGRSNMDMEAKERYLEERDTIFQRKEDTTTGSNAGEGRALVHGRAGTNADVRSVFSNLISIRQMCYDMWLNSACFLWQVL
jgi:hypothetical protein